MEFKWSRRTYPFEPTTKERFHYRYFGDIYDNGEVIDRAFWLPAYRVYVQAVDLTGRRGSAFYDVLFKNPYLRLSQDPPERCTTSRVESALIIGSVPAPPSGGATVRGDALELAHRCPRGENLCGATVVGSVALAGNRVLGRPGAAAGRRRSRIVRITKKVRFSVPPGETARASLPLNARGRSLLRSKRLRRVRLTYTPLALQGKPKSRTRVIPVRQTRRRP